MKIKPNGKEYIMQKNLPGLGGPPLPENHLHSLTTRRSNSFLVLAAYIFLIVLHVHIKT